jgi:tRNA-binding protein
VNDAEPPALEEAAPPPAPAKKPSYKLTFDFWAIGTRISSAAVLPCYALEELVGRLVVAVANFPPRMVGPVRSEVLVLGAVEADGRVKLLRPDPDATPGSRIA